MKNIRFLKVYLIINSFMKLYLYIYTLLILFSCKENKVAKENPIELKTDSIKEIPKIELSKTDLILDELNADKSLLYEKLKSENTDDFNNLFENFKAKREIKIAKLNELEENLLANYINFYDNNSQKYILPDSLKVKNSAFEKANLEFWGVGEGFTELRSEPNFYYNTFKNYVTIDYSDFLLLEAKDNSVLYSADAGISITFEEVSERVLYWENYLNKYPKSKLFEKAREDFINYCTNYLFGMDNTPTFEYSNNEIYPENQLEFDRFISKNPKSKLSALVNLLMTNIKKMNADELRKMLNDKCSKLYNPK